MTRLASITPKRLGVATAACAASAVIVIGLIPLVLRPANPSVGPRLGIVHFANSCGPDVQPDFDRAMAMLHSFWTKDAVAGFAAVQSKDHACPIAAWGLAMALQQNPLSGLEPPPELRARALAALDAAKEMAGGTTRERDYLAAVDVLYRHSDQDFAARRQAYATAMEELATRYPTDTEARIFYALALEMTAQPTDRAAVNRLKAAAILQEIFAKQPDHPGIAHYLVHAFDTPSLAANGLVAACRYAEIAPDNPHALHMPSHIFTRLGLWQNSVDANVRSAAAAKAEGNGQEQSHALDYLVYAYLQLGEDKAAQDVAIAAGSLTVNPDSFIGPYALAAIPARYAVERRAWGEAVRLEIRPSKFPFTQALTHFARGLGFALLKQSSEARHEATELAGIRDLLGARNDTYWSKQVEVQRLAVDAWAALGEGRREQAAALMQASADLETTMEKHIVTPGPIVPAGELYGEMLLTLGKPAAALAVFRSSVQREPGRLMGLYDLAKAADAAGDRQEAAAAYRKLAALPGARAQPRPQLQEAVFITGIR